MCGERELDVWYLIITSTIMVGEEKVGAAHFEKLMDVGYIV
jgi:hypothetical protein